MATNIELTLSGSTSGKGIVIGATSNPGTLIHTATVAPSTLDNIWLFAQNNHIAAVTLTIEFGGNAISDQIIMTLLNKEGLVLVIPGLPLNNGLEIRAFAGVTDVINLRGLVNRRTD